MKSFSEFISEIYDIKPSSFQHKYTSAGRETSKRTCQSGDCTVRAVATVENRPYDEVFDMLKSYGRENNRGFYFEDGYLKKSKNYEEKQFEKFTKVKDIGAKFKKGRYVVICHSKTVNGKSIKWRHALALIDGVVNDALDGDDLMTTMVESVWKYKAKSSGASEWNTTKSSKDTWEGGIWNNGTWKDGTWEKGTWKDGIWSYGNWKSGTWWKGTWKNGIWKDGIWKSGIWKNGTWMKGKWEKGNWENGVWVKGTWEDGTWGKGTWQDGIWKYGLWWNGTWKGGTWKGGAWRGGYDKDGNFHKAGDSPDKWVK